MNNEIKITVIVPAYNVENWFPRCIESIINQTYHNLEILVINDGSNDRTGEILEEYANKDSRIIPVHQENQGLIEVRERGIEMATGQYIGFVDGDDEIELEMYERLLNNALLYEAEISQCGIKYCFYDIRNNFKRDTSDIYIFDNVEGYRELMQGTRIEPSLCNKLYKRELLKNSCLDKTIVNNEDLLRNSVLFSRANKSVFEDFCGYHYWRRTGSMSNNARVVQNAIHILKARRIIMERASSEVWKYAFECYITALITTYNALLGNNKEDAIQLMKKCKSELYSMQSQFSHLNSEIRYKGYGILCFPLIYNMFYRLHVKIRHKKIRRQIKSYKYLEGNYIE